MLAVGTVDGGQPDYRPTRHTVLRPGDEALLVGPYEQVVSTFRRSLG